MVEFICMGLLEMQGTQLQSKRKIQNENILPIMGFEPGISRFYEADSLLIAPRDRISTIG